MASRSLCAVIITHLPSEDFGTLESRLTESGFQTRTADATTARFPPPQANGRDLLVIVGAWSASTTRRFYPLLTAAIDCIRQCVPARTRTLSVCRGAKLAASAIGARVYRDRGPEPGRSPIQLPAGVTAPQ